MTVFVVIAAIVLGSAPSALANATENQQLLQKKLTSPFLQNGKWTTSLEEAKKLAAEQDRVIFTYFTRSYAP